jgi:flagellar biosynthesis chaperone FliJ
MKAFRFRASAVLDVRRKQHEQAESELARTQQERDAAARVVRDADDACGRAERDYRAQLGEAHATDAVERHRNWIALKQAERADRQRRLEERLLDVQRATRASQDTFMRLRALERLRDRVWQKYQADARRHDAIEMDQLAVIQYARRTGGGIACDD